MRTMIRHLTAACCSAALLTGCLPDFITVPSEAEVIAEGQGPSGLALSSDPTPWQANLQWSDRSQIETSFHIQRRTLDDNGEPEEEFADVGTAVVNQVWWADQNVVTDTSYEYRVEAFQGVVKLGTSSTVTAKIPTYQPVTTHVFEGPMTYETAVLSDPAIGYPTIVYDQGEAGLIGYYLDSHGFHGPVFLNDGLGRYDVIQKTHRLWWDGDSLFRVADVLRQSGRTDTVFTGWQRVGSRLELTRMWGASFAPFEGDVIFGSSVYGDRRVVFAARSGLLCPIVLTGGISPTTNVNHECLEEDLAQAINAPLSMVGFDEGKKLLLSTETAAHTINVETPGLMQILNTQTSSDPVRRFFVRGSHVWGRTDSGTFLAFENVPDYNSGGGSELSTEFEISSNEFLYTATDTGERQITVGCTQGLEITWQGRLLQTIPLDYCAVDAMLLSSTTLWILADSGDLVLYDLGPRFGSWPPDRRR